MDPSQVPLRFRHMPPPLANSNHPPQSFFVTSSLHLTRVLYSTPPSRIPLDRVFFASNPSSCPVLVLRYMSLALAMAPELATLPTNSNGMCRSSIATRYHDPSEPHLPPPSLFFSVGPRNIGAGDTSCPVMKDLVPLDVSIPIESPNPSFFFTLYFCTSAIFLYLPSALFCYSHTVATTYVLTLPRYGRLVRCDIPAPRTPSSRLYVLTTYSSPHQH